LNPLRSLILTAACAASLAACSERRAAAIAVIQGPTMGTRYAVSK